MKLRPRIPLLLTLTLLFSLPAMAAALNLAVETEVGGPVKFATEEIRREAKAKGITLSNDADATRIIIQVDSDAKATPQRYSTRVQTDGGKRTITVTGSDPAGAMYGGLDIAEAIRLGTLEKLKSSENKPHIEKRGIKFNIPLDLRTPSYTDCSDAAQANIPEVWKREFWIDYHRSKALRVLWQISRALA